MRTDGDGTGNNADTDDDNDGASDLVDVFPLDPDEIADRDGDGIGDNADTDNDNDGSPDDVDAFPADPFEAQDTDGDGTGNNADADDDNDGVPDVVDAFPLDNKRSEADGSDTDGDGVDDSLDLDDDNDGIPDTIETTNQLDPLNAADALLDLDGDGRSNLDEFLAGGSIQVDDIGPVIDLISPYVIDADGQQTVPAFNVTATDAKDGPVTPTPDLAGAFSSGRHEIIWTAADAAGNAAISSQILEIRAIANWQPDQIASEGREVSLQVFLSGPAIRYPLTLPLSAGGSADAADFVAVPGSITIESGTSGSVSVGDRRRCRRRH